jgi:uncharacterized protein YuzE
MKIKYDDQNDAIYVIFSDDKVMESETVDSNVVVDYNSKDEVVAIEVLNIKDSEHTIDLPFVLKSA